MIIIAIVLFILSVLLLLSLIMILRQVRDICRRLGFIKTHDTNMRLTSSTPFPQLNSLVDSVNDILDKTAEERLSAAKESRALKDSITGISHDIRTPLTSLSGYFQLLTRSYNTDNACDEQERRQYTDIINARITDLESMLEELFTYTKLQNDEYDIELERIDFTKCVISSMFAFYQQFSDRGISPDADIDDTPVFITGNTEAVRRILQNILKNALVHGKDYIGVSLRRKGGSIEFVCSNNCAAPEDIDIDSVFRKFYKADAARRATSSGIGLTVAYELVQRLGGDITAELNEDIFSIKLVFEICDKVI